MQAMHTLSLMAAVLGMGVAEAAPVPEHFSDRAKELFKDNIELNTPQEVGEVRNMLNVVYFVGNDRDPIADYERRLSELMIYVQQFYGKEMARNGYGNRSFALPILPNGNVGITLVKGKEPMASYGYNGNAASKALSEIYAYFKQHPEADRGQHTLVILPTQLNAEYSHDQPGGVPFFGFGRHCFALDYQEFDIKHAGQDTKYGHLLCKWLGGLAHELGHGLNLPHNKGIPSSNEAYGTALMGAGNFTFSMKPTYLTPETCAILDVCEAFPSQNRPEHFYAKPEVLLEKVVSTVVRKDGKFEIEIKLPADQVKDIKHVNFYMQDPPYVVNRDYDAVPFTGRIEQKDNEMVVSCTMSEQDLAELTAEERQISAVIMLSNGFRYRWDVEFLLADIREGQAIRYTKENLRVSSY